MKDIQRFIRITTVVASLLVIIALSVLFARAVLRLDTAEDTFTYHIPFAAMNAGIHISFTVPDIIYDRYEGFPPLPEFFQGILWRSSGNLNAIGTINFIAFCMFIIFCKTQLKADFSIVSMIALTSPMILIHMTVGYIDLFANALLAVGICSLIAMYYFDRQDSNALLLFGLAGISGAAWSKFLMVPMCLALFLLLFFMQIRRISLNRVDAYKRILLIAVFFVIASAPYLKNTIKYSNPFWPISVPYLEEIVPFTEDTRGYTGIACHKDLLGEGNFSRFFISLFEIYSPSASKGEDRWNIDQGGHLINTKSFRMGGFWNVAVIVFNLSLFIMAASVNREKGIVLIISIIVFYLIFAFLQQSNELRYHQFMPLSWAGVVAVLLPEFSKRHAKTGAVFIVVLLSMFLFISFVNRNYYKIEKTGYFDLTNRLGMDRIWNKLTPGETYCLRRQLPETIFLTGPTMTEFNIVILNKEDQPCPNNGKEIGLNENI